MAAPRRSWFTAADCNLDDFAAIVEEPVLVGDYPRADRVERGVVVYDRAALRPQLASSEFGFDLPSEWASVLDSGPGVLLLSGAQETSVVDEATSGFGAILESEKENRRWRNST